MVNHRAQVLAEYVLFFAIIIIGALFMATYVRRAVQGRINQSAGDIGGRYEYGGKTVSIQNTNIMRDIATNIVFDEAGKIVTSNTTIQRDDAYQYKNENVSD